MKNCQNMPEEAEGKGSGKIAGMGIVRFLIGHFDEGAVG